MSSNNPKDSNKSRSTTASTTINPDVDPSFIKRTIDTIQQRMHIHPQQQHHSSHTVDQSQLHSDIDNNSNIRLNSNRIDNNASGSQGVIEDYMHSTGQFHSNRNTEPMGNSNSNTVSIVDYESIVHELDIM